MQATQRAGRAGRTQHGKCYRLYTQRFFEADMPEATVPEIQRTSMLTAVLYLKTLPLDIDVLAFDYLDSPGVSARAPCGPQICTQPSCLPAGKRRTMHLKPGTDGLRQLGFWQLEYR